MRNLYELQSSVMPVLELNVVYLLQGKFDVPVVQLGLSGLSGLRQGNDNETLL